jgi:rubredoxin
MPSTSTTTNDTLDRIVCPSCGGPAVEVIYAQQKLRRGWYCPQCGHFEKALRRERIIED